MILIDTHILIWMLEKDLRGLGPLAQDILKTQPITVSAVTLIEIAVKKRKGKLDMPETNLIATTLEAKNVAILPIQTQHINNLPNLEETPHADPFDLLLMAQAISERLPLLTCDEEILKITPPGLQLLDGRQ